MEQFEAIGNEHGLACALDNLARVLVRSGEDEAGMACLERAVEILARIGHGQRRSGAGDVASRELVMALMTDRSS